MKLPSLIRAAAIERIKVALISPATAAVRSKPKPITPIKPITAAKPFSPSLNPVTPITKEVNLNLAKSVMDNSDLLKHAGLDSVLRTVSMFGDDAVEALLRKTLADSSRAMAAPVLAERVHQISDPNYEPNPSVYRAKKILAIASKTAGLGSAQGLTEDRGGFQDHAVDMKTHNHDALAGGSLTPPDAVNAGFNRLRAYMKNDSPPMETDVGPIN